MSPEHTASMRLSNSIGPIADVTYAVVGVVGPFPGTALSDAGGFLLAASAEARPFAVWRVRVACRC